MLNSARTHTEIIAMASRKTPAKKSAAKTPKKSTAKMVAKAPAQKIGAKKAAKKSAGSSPHARVRAICLGLPEAEEVAAWGAPTYRVKNKLFAMYAAEGNHHHDGRPAIWIYSTHVEQDLVIRARPDCYFKPPYVGPSGWIGAFVDGKPPWMEITELIREGYRRRAPKKLAALLGE